MKAIKAAFVMMAAFACLTFTQGNEAHAGTCNVRMKVINNCPHVVKLVYVSFAHTKGPKNKYVVPTLGFKDLKSSKKASWKHFVLRSCATKKRMKVQYRHPKKGNSYADWKVRTVYSGKQKGKKIEIKLTKCW